MPYKLAIPALEFSIVLSDLNTVLDFIKQFVKESDRVELVIEKIKSKDTTSVSYKRCSPSC